MHTNITRTRTNMHTHMQYVSGEHVCAHIQRWESKLGRKMMYGATGRIGRNREVSSLYAVYMPPF